MTFFLRPLTLLTCLTASVAGAAAVPLAMAQPPVPGDSSLHSPPPFSLQPAPRGVLAVQPLPAGASSHKKQPVLLIAEQVGYDSDRSVAIAIGRVEVVQADTILLADRVEYDQNTDVVHATGHVSLLEPAGDVYFANDAWLNNQMQKGVIKQFKARLKDNSLFAAKEAQKINALITKMKDGVYSPCPVCAKKADEEGSSPLWQMEGRTITIDEQAKVVRYRDAFVDVYGVPVIYTPYFSHPTPDAPSQTGLLTPQYFHATDLGNVVKEPVFISFTPSMDMTIIPWYLSSEKPLLEADFRQMTTSGYYEIKGAITNTYNRDADGNIVPGDQTRGYIQANGKLHLDPLWDVGVDAERTTDNTFLQLYRFGWQDILSSRLYAERIKDRDYFDIEALAFQGLEVEDIRSQSPYALPQANLHLESDPLALHSRLQLDSNALVLERSAGDTDQRVSSTAAWKIPVITPGGQVIEAKASLRGDAYNINDQITNVLTNDSYSGQQGRLIPQVDMDWRYPLINRFKSGGSLLIAPEVMAAASPDLNNNNRIPNEDSPLAELSDINIFSPNRFTGLDQVESGLRGAYGMRGQLEFADQKYLQWLFGQAFEDNTSNPFPIAADTDSHASDYIGRMALKYKWLDAVYSFRVDKRTLTPISNEINTQLALNPLSFDISYVSLRNEPEFGDRQEVFGSTSLDVTPTWRFGVSGRKDLGSVEKTPVNPALPESLANPFEVTAGTVGLNTSLTYHNECVNLVTTLGRSYINEQDVKPSTTFTVVLLLKNFGSATAGATSSLVTGPGNIETVGVPSADTTSFQTQANSQGSKTDAAQTH